MNNEHTADLEKVLENQNNQNGNDDSLISNSTLNVSKVFNQDMDRVETEGLDYFVIPLSKYLINLLSIIF